MTRHYLSRKQVAERRGVTPDSLSRYKLPTPDVMIGDVKGWRPETIDRWIAAAPGRGNWSHAGTPRAKRSDPPGGIGGSQEGP